MTRPNARHMTRCAYLRWMRTRTDADLVAYIAADRRERNAR